MKKIVWMLPLFLGLLFIGTDIDTDDWFLLANGRYVESFGIPHTNPFPMHEDWAFVMEQWLFALGLWKLYSAFGFAALTGYAVLCGALVIFLYDRLVREASGGDSRFAELTLVLPVGALCSLLFFVPRPQVVSTAVLLAEVLILERCRTARPRWIFVLLPVLSALLVNLHAALWPMFLVLLLPYLAEALLGKRLARWLPYDAAVAWKTKDILALLALCFFAGFLNPYGWDAMMFSPASYGIEGLRENIKECRPLSIGGSLSVPFGCLVFLLYFGLCAAYVHRPVPLRHVLLAAGTGFMGLLSIRSLFLFLLFATFPLARLLAGRALPQPAWTPRRKRVCAALLLANVCAFAFWWQRTHHDAPPYPPQGVAAVDELLAAAEGKAPQELRVYTGFDVGNYVEFRGFRPYIDARPELYMTVQNHTADIFTEYLAMQRGKRPYQDVLDKYPFDALLVRRDDILWHYLPLDARYTCVWDSADAGVTGREEDDMRIYRKK